MAPPAVQKEAEEEGVDCSSVEMVSVDVEYSVSLESGGWPP